MAEAFRLVGSINVDEIRRSVEQVNTLLSSLGTRAGSSQRQIASTADGLARSLRAATVQTRSLRDAMRGLGTGAGLSRIAASIGNIPRAAREATSGLRTLQTRIRSIGTTTSIGRLATQVNRVSASMGRLVASVEPATAAIAALQAQIGTLGTNSSVALVTQQIRQLATALNPAIRQTALLQRGLQSVRAPRGVRQAAQAAAQPAQQRLSLNASLGTERYIALNAQLSRTQQLLGNLRGAATAAAQPVARLAGSLGRAFVGRLGIGSVTGAVVGLGFALVRTSSITEDFVLRIQTFSGGIRDARQNMRALIQTSNQLGISFTSAQRPAGSLFNVLRAGGASSQESLGEVQSALRAARALGATSESEIFSIVTALERIRTRGRIGTQELQPLAFAGVSSEEIGQALNLSGRQVTQRLAQSAAGGGPLLTQGQAITRDGQRINLRPGQQAPEGAVTFEQAVTRIPQLVGSRLPDEAIDTLSASIARVGNAWTNLVQASGRLGFVSGAAGAVSGALNALAGALPRPAQDATPRERLSNRIIGRFLREEDEAPTAEDLGVENQPRAVQQRAISQAQSQRQQEFIRETNQRIQGLSDEEVREELREFERGSTTRTPLNLDDLAITSGALNPLDVSVRGAASALGDFTTQILQGGNAFQALFRGLANTGGQVVQNVALTQISRFVEGVAPGSLSRNSARS